MITFLGFHALFSLFLKSPQILLNMNTENGKQGTMNRMTIINNYLNENKTNISLSGTKVSLYGKMGLTDFISLVNLS